MPDEVASNDGTLHDHIQKMRSTVRAAVAMRKAKDKPEAAEQVVEDIILVTLINVKQGKMDWLDDPLLANYIKATNAKS